jgi:hypothetical protein
MLINQFFIVLIVIARCCENDSSVGNCKKFYFTFEFEYQMWDKIFQKFEKDQISIGHLLN